ncbi:MAG: hypothetical protein GF315_06185 [candidate division Zixibacteria bacterium]|nr:hypothetical protein [candidate division Zixibacteria bacterium]
MEFKTSINQIIPICIILILTVSVIGIGNGDAGHGDEVERTEPSDSVEQLSRSELYSRIDSGYQELKPIFERGCYDCHTYNTEYPWYHKLPIAKQIIDGDIEEGRGELLIGGGFPFKSDRKPGKDLVVIKEVLQEDEMPLWQYELLHWDAEPSEEEVDSIINWIDNSLHLLVKYGYLEEGELKHKH